jgi:multiple sugar transport system permease protein
MNISNPVQWLNQYPLPTVAMIAVWSGFAFPAITILATLQGIPKEQYEAAKIDAAGRFAVFRSIEWPNLMPLNVVLWLFGLITALNTFNVIFVLTGGGPGFETTTLFLYAYRNLGTYATPGSGDYAYTAMIATLLLASEMVIGIVYIRYLMLRKK